MTSETPAVDLPPTLPRLFTIEQVAQALRLSKRTIRRLIDDERLKVVRIRHSVRVRQEDLDLLIRGNCQRRKENDRNSQK